MSIGLGIFASVVLVLLVLHPGFRKFSAWFAGVAAVIVGLYVGGAHLVERHQEKARAAAWQARIDACVERAVKAGWNAFGCFDNPDIPIPPDYKPKDSLDGLGAPAFDSNKPYQKTAPIDLSAGLEPKKQMPNVVEACKKGVAVVTVCRNRDGSYTANPQYLETLPEAK